MIVALLLFLVRAIFVSAWILLGLLAELAFFPLLARGQRKAVVGWWSRGLMRLCGIKRQTIGEPKLKGAVLWVANHVSWVDIFILNSVRPTSFIAKSDVRAWPIIGHLVAWSGTLFIDRNHRHAVRQASKQMQDCFAHGDVVGLFPEGTSTDGMDVRNFHAGLFDAAVQAKAPVQPVALRYYRRGQRAPELAFVGEQTLVANLWLLLGSWGVVVECEFLPLQPVHADTSRSKLASAAHNAIRQAVITLD